MAGSVVEHAAADGGMRFLPLIHTRQIRRPTNPKQEKTQGSKVQAIESISPATDCNRAAIPEADMRVHDRSAY